MKTAVVQSRGKRVSPPPLVELLGRRVVGQSQALEAIAPYVQIYQAGLSPEGRPAGVFLLLGPSGTGKTRTVEALAEVLHGSEKSLLRIDCGEYQMEHEVAKLIGAPPGYLGHRETQPLLTQQKLSAITSEKSSLSLVLFDEVEKAAPSLNRLLLGILDKAVLRLGDNTTVNFERSMIFLTSNLGSRSMLKCLCPDFGFAAGAPRPEKDVLKLEKIGIEAARRKFPPEFLNRIDRIITYQPLDEEALAEILDQHIEEFQRHVNARLGPRAVKIEVPPETRRTLLRLGASREYGARELKRTLHRHLTEPLAELVAGGRLGPGAAVRLVVEGRQKELVLEHSEDAAGAGESY